MPIEHIFDACMVALSHLKHDNKLLIATKPIRNWLTPAAAINEQKPVLTVGIPFLFTPILSHFFPPSPSPQLLQHRLGDMKCTYSSGLCSSRPRWPLPPNFCSRATRKSQIFHTNHMLGTLNFTGSEHWAPFNFP